MRNLKLKGIVVVTALTIMLTGCTTTNQTINKENNNSSITQETIYEDTTKKEDVIIETSPEKVETTPFGQVSEVKQSIPVNGRQITDDIFEITMLDGTVKKFYVGNLRIHNFINQSGRNERKMTFNLVEM